MSDFQDDTIFNDLTDNQKQELLASQIKISATNPPMAMWLGKAYLGQTDDGLSDVQPEMIISKEAMKDILKNQIYLAKTSPEMAMWLGKNYLEQNLLS